MGRRDRSATPSVFWPVAGLIPQIGKGLHGKEVVSDFRLLQTDDVRAVLGQPGHSAPDAHSNLHPGGDT